MYEKIINEITLYSKLNHRNIIKLKDVLLTHDQTYLILEHCNCENLLEFLCKYQKLFKHNPTMKVTQILFTQIIEGLYYMFTQKCIHRDLKLDNIMLSKTSDFLQSINIDEKKLNDFMIAPSIEQEQKDEDLIIDFCKKSPEFWNISYTKNEKGQEDVQK